jgi:hypothetical protein
LRVGSNGEDGGSSLLNLGGDEGRAIIRIRFSDARRGVLEKKIRRVRRVIGRDLSVE